MDLTDFQRKAILLIFISVLVGSILLARKEPFKVKPEKTGVVEEKSPAPKITAEKPPAKTAQPPPAPKKIDINTADAGTLEQLPGIGPVISKEIINYRTENGPFFCMNDLLNVPGIGVKKLKRIKNEIDLPENIQPATAETTISAPAIAKQSKPDIKKLKQKKLGTICVYDSRIDPDIKCPYCNKEMWEKGKKKTTYIRCPRCLKLLS